MRDFKWFQFDNSGPVHCEREGIIQLIWVYETAAMYIHIHTYTDIKSHKRIIKIII